MSIQFETKFMKDKSNHTSGLLLFGTGKSLTFTLFVDDHWIHLQDNKQGKSCNITFSNIKQLPTLLDTIEKLHTFVKKKNNKKQDPEPPTNRFKFYRDKDRNLCAQLKYAPGKGITVNSHDDEVWIHIQGRTPLSFKILAVGVVYWNCIPLEAETPHKYTCHLPTSLLEFHNNVSEDDFWNCDNFNIYIMDLCELLEAKTYNSTSQFGAVTRILRSTVKTRDVKPRNDVLSMPISDGKSDKTITLGLDEFKLFVVLRDPMVEIEELIAEVQKIVALKK